MKDDYVGETRAICYSNISKEYNTIEIKHSINTMDKYGHIPNNARKEIAKNTDKYF